MLPFDLRGQEAVSHHRQSTTAVLHLGGRLHSGNDPSAKSAASAALSALQQPAHEAARRTRALPPSPCSLHPSQGVREMFTDPQIHSYDGRGFGMGNMGRQGIARFLNSHRCNDICRTLQLPPLCPPARPGPGPIGAWGVAPGPGPCGMGCGPMHDPRALQRVLQMLQQAPFGGARHFDVPIQNIRTAMQGPGRGGYVVGPGGGGYGGGPGPGAYGGGPGYEGYGDGRYGVAGGMGARWQRERQEREVQQEREEQRERHELEEALGRSLAEAQVWRLVLCPNPILCCAANALQRFCVSQIIAICANDS